MSEAELIIACIKNDKTAKKQFFESYYSKLAYISLRYSKNSAQAEQVTLKGFSHIFAQLPGFRSQVKQNLEEFTTHQFISFVVNHIKSIRNEYYVASTIKAVETTDHTYDLFLDSGLIDLKSSNPEILLKSIQELVPSQRLVFNLHVIDNYTLASISELLETSEQTIKSNLEKARFNLQKAIERNLKLSNNEQPV
jgi:RNA polymerase sigma factor (sigma-70 family)